MDFFRNARVVRLRSRRGQYLIAEDEEETVALWNEEDVAKYEEKIRRETAEEMRRKTDEEMRRRDRVAWMKGLKSHHDLLMEKDNEETIALRDEKTRRGDITWWSVEFNSDSVLHLKSRCGKYLTASYQRSLHGMTGCQVLQSPPPLNSSHELEPVMEGTHVKLRTHYGTFLRANGDNLICPESITHDLPHRTTILWNVEVVEREEEESATNIDDKASEEGPATKRSHKTGEGSSATRSPQKDSGPLQEADRINYCRHFWKLKSLLLDSSSEKHVLVTGESAKEAGTTALVREVCTDVLEDFATIAWISIPQKNDYHEILLQHIIERATRPRKFKTNSWRSMDPGFSLRQPGGCLIVVDNLEDQRIWEKFDVLHKLKTCRVIFIDRLGSSYGQIEKRGHKFEPCELKGRPYELQKYISKDTNGYGTQICQLIVRKCEKLPTAIVFVLHNQKDEWEARIPPGNLFQELPVIQQALVTVYKGLLEGKGPELDSVQTALKIICTDRRKLWLLYLGIFPENTPISYKKICRSWAAEGLERDLRLAEHFLRDESSLAKCIRPVERSDGEPSTFQLDKRVRDIIVSMSNLSDLVISEHSPNWLLVQGEIKALNEEKSLHISLVFMLDVSSNEDKITTSETPSFPSSPKVLDLTGAHFEVIPDEAFGLTKLRYFCLRNTPIKRIPGSIEKFTYLEFLDAKHSLVTELPKEFGLLTSIRQILIYHHEKDPLMNSYDLIGFRASCSIGGFKDLEKLCFVRADETILKDLVNLTKLRRLGITKLRKKHVKLLCSALENLQLLSLNVHALDQDEILDLSPPGSRSTLLNSLERLYLHGRLKKLPDWISAHENLTRIILRWSHLEEDLLATLGKLQNLVELELRRAYDGEKLEFNGRQFRKLKILLLEELEGLRSMSLEEGALLSLESLTISGCHWLEMIPSGILEIRALRKLTFFNMSSEFYDRVRVDHEQDQYQKFKNIKEVYFARWRAGHWETHQGESADEAHCSQQVDRTDKRVESTDEKGEIRLKEFYDRLYM